MKLIGIINKYDKSRCNHDISYSYLDIIRYIIKVGGYPIQISLSSDNLSSTKDFLCGLNGVIFSGGDDYTDLELDVLKFLYDNDIPTLGICLGMQTMALLFDAGLDLVSGHYNTYHEVSLRCGSKIYSILGKDRIFVNSRHKYKVLGCSLSASGFSDVIEVIEDSNKRFFIGVQWHPESLDCDDSYNLFNYFVNVRG